MATWKINKGTLIDIANAIREKTGGSELITVSNFADEIASIDGSIPGSPITPSTDTTIWIIQSDTLEAIGDAIRAKRGTVEEITVSNLADEILQISPLAAKPITGLKISKTASRCEVNSQLSTNDIVVKAVYNDGTEEIVNAEIDTSNIDTSEAGIILIGIRYQDHGAVLPVIIYDSNATEANKLIMQDTDWTYNDGLWWKIKNNLLYIKGKDVSGGNSYLKISNTPEYNRGSTLNSWAQESIPIVANTQYSFFNESIAGAQGGAGVASFRDSSKASILSNSRTPNTPTTNGAYVQYYTTPNNLFVNYICGIMGVEGGTAPTRFTYQPSGQDTGIEIEEGNIDPLTPITSQNIFIKSLTSTITGYTYYQSFYDAGTYMYLTASNNGGANVMDYVVVKIDTTNWTKVGETSFTVGHGNDITYCDYDGYLHVVSLDENWTIYRIDTNLNYIDTYAPDLTSEYSGYIGMGGITYCAEKEKFVYLLRKTDNTYRRYAIFDKTRTFETLYTIPTETSVTYANILSDGKYIYQLITKSQSANILQEIVKYDWNLNRIESFGLMASAQREVEGLCWNNDDNSIYVLRVDGTMNKYPEIRYTQENQTILDTNNAQATGSSTAQTSIVNNTFYITFTYNNSNGSLELIWDPTDIEMKNQDMMMIKCDDYTIDEIPAGSSTTGSIVFYDSEGSSFRTQALMKSTTPLTKILFYMKNGGLPFAITSAIAGYFNSCAKFRLVFNITGTSGQLAQAFNVSIENPHIDIISKEK